MKFFITTILKSNKPIPENFIIRIYTVNLGLPNLVRVFKLHFERKNTKQKIRLSDYRFNYTVVQGQTKDRKHI
jgi:hypothetical protein